MLRSVFIIAFSDLNTYLLSVNLVMSHYDLQQEWNKRKSLLVFVLSMLLVCKL